MLNIIGLTLAAGALLYGYTGAKQFVRTRLRFVDGVLSRAAPLVAGSFAAVVAVPLCLVMPLPFFGYGTAALFGVAVGVGVRAGARQIRGAAGYIKGS